MACEVTSQGEVIKGMNTDSKEKRLKDHPLNYSSVKGSDEKEQVKKTGTN